MHRISRNRSGGRGVANRSVVWECGQRGVCLCTTGRLRCFSIVRSVTGGNRGQAISIIYPNGKENDSGDSSRHRDRDDDIRAVCVSQVLYPPTRGGEMHARYNEAVCLAGNYMPRNQKGCQVPGSLNPDILCSKKHDARRFLTV